MNWAQRFLKRLGLTPDSPEAKDALAGTSKHRRQRTKPKDHEAKLRKRRKMAKESRRRNR